VHGFVAPNGWTGQTDLVGYIRGPTFFGTGARLAVNPALVGKLMLRFWDAVALAWPYANNLHLTTDR